MWRLAAAPRRRPAWHCRRGSGDEPAGDEGEDGAAGDAECEGCGAGLALRSERQERAQRFAVLARGHRLTAIDMSSFQVRRKIFATAAPDEAHL